jgi:hypothetical protein
VISRNRLFRNDYRGLRTFRAARNRVLFKRYNEFLKAFWAPQKVERLLFPENTLLCMLTPARQQSD